MARNSITAILLISLFALVPSCDSSETTNPEVGSTDPVEPREGRTVIAFGSNAHEYDEQLIWNAVVENKPSLWIWLGNIVYGDTRNMELLSRKYDIQKNKPGYQKLRENTPVIGTWGDHDYGRNMLGKQHPMKAESRQLLFTYLEIPADNPAWSREGAYYSYELEDQGRSVKVILLDTRYFRDYVGDTADVLGDAQWAWLEEELVSSTADLNIVASGVQVLAEEHSLEKWADFPAARTRLFDLLTHVGGGPVFILSGDRDFAEISRKEIEGLPYPLYDFTSSGLTHSKQDLELEINLHRVQYPIPVKNFGLIIIDWAESPSVTFQVRDIDNTIVLKHQPELVW